MFWLNSIYIRLILTNQNSGIDARYSYNMVHVVCTFVYSLNFVEISSNQTVLCNIFQYTQWIQNDTQYEQMAYLSSPMQIMIISFCTAVNDCVQIKFLDNLSCLSKQFQGTFCVLSWRRSWCKHILHVYEEGKNFDKNIQYMNENSIKNECYNLKIQGHFNFCCTRFSYKI